MIPPDPKHYSMTIEWSGEDQVYIVTVPELPGCRTHGSTYEEALKQGQDAIESWIMAAVADNDPVPTPKRYRAASRTERCIVEEEYRKRFWKTKPH